jgi:hypothetical protein
MGRRKFMDLSFGLSLAAAAVARSASMRVYEGLPAQHFRGDMPLDFLKIQNGDNTNLYGPRQAYAILALDVCSLLAHSSQHLLLIRLIVELGWKYITKFKFS